MQQVDYGRALCGAACFRNGIAFNAESAALVCEEHDIGMRACDENILKEIFFTGCSRTDADAASALRAIGCFRNALDVAVMGAGNNHVFFLDDVVHIDVFNDLCDFGAARIGKAAPNLEHFIFNNAHKFAFVRKQGSKVFNRALKLTVLGFQLFALKPRQPLQPHVKYRLRLPFTETETCNQPFLCFCAVCTGFDDGNDFVNIVQCDHKAFQDVQPFAGFVKVKLRAAGDNILLMRNVVIKHFAKVEHLGFAVHKRDHDNAESILKLSVLIQIVQHNVCIDILFKLDNNAHSRAGAFVAKVGNAVHALLVNKLRNFFNKLCFVDLIRNFRDNDS